MFRRKKKNPLLEEDGFLEHSLDEPEINNEPTITPKIQKHSKTKSISLHKLKFKLADLTSSQKLGLYLILGTLTIMFIVSPLAKTLETFNHTTVIVAKENIPKGTKITNDQLKEVTSIKNNNLIQIELSISDVIGAYAISDINKDGIISKANISNSPPAKNQYLYELPSQKKAISITTQTSASSVSSKIRSGDIVSIYSYMGGTGDIFRPATLMDMLKYVEVLDVTNSDSLSITDGSENIEISTVTLLVDDIQAMTLLGLEQNSTLHLALVSRGDTERASELLDIQYNINNDTVPLSGGIIYE